ncbi:hypothetical protein [Thermococcus waiotapuensis]|uniref:Uncharacterized protein n=1 Tax=Thermococcus waiotapuensis TaxID=90909 RepID=A0AAE4NTB0_9EURY|nr:hypothetical protein [Thermococcus waiotapuensis]MDV3103948.1 hypothetical protein [Thermococcus waiotapuensis]
MKVLGVLLLVFTLASMGVYFENVPSREKTVNFRPVYLSNVSLDVRFSNKGQELQVVDFSNVGKVAVESSKPALIVGIPKLPRLESILNVTLSIVPLNVSPEAILIYNERMVLLLSGDLGQFLEWASEVLDKRSGWGLGLYSGNSGVLLGTPVLRVETPPENWSAVGGELYRRRLILKTIVPGKEKVDFYLIPLNGELLDYDPTTTYDPSASNSKGVIVHDRSSFSRNIAGWSVENPEERNVELWAIIGVNSESLKLQYNINGMNGLVEIRIES